VEGVILMRMTPLRCAEPGAKPRTPGRLADERRLTGLAETKYVVCGDVRASSAMPNVGVVMNIENS
jgi:hypothetical protein